MNGVVISGQGRDPASFLESICSAFNTPPAECDEVLSSTAPSSGFGWDGAGSDSDAQCG